MEKIIAIDPGGDGGFAVFIDGNLQELHTIPKVKGKVDYNQLYKMWKDISEGSNMIIMEEVHSIFGTSANSNFSFGHINGFLLGIVVSCLIPYILVQPKEWQKDIWINQDKVFKPGKTKKTIDTKSTSLLAAKRLFPNTDFRKSSKSEKFHDGLVDAGLIGKWFLMNRGRVLKDNL